MYYRNVKSSTLDRPWITLTQRNTHNVMCLILRVCNILYDLWPCHRQCLSVVRELCTCTVYMLSGLEEQVPDGLMSVVFWKSFVSMGEMTTHHHRHHQKCRQREWNKSHQLENSFSDIALLVCKWCDMLIKVLDQGSCPAYKSLCDRNVKYKISPSLAIVLVVHW